MLLISPHIDRVIQEFRLSYNKGIHTGLLDNILGILLTYITLYDNQNLIDLEKESKIKIWHNTGEEWGRLVNPPELTQEDIAMIVDVADQKEYDRYDFSIENISGFTSKELQKLKAMLKWEGFHALVKRYTGRTNDQDESWLWRKRKIKTLSFIIPIDAQDTGWHRIQQDNNCSVEKMKICQQGLKRLINFLVD
jgi:hypothetical protein